jgi:uncharacterized protein (DUF58 family)
MTAPPANAATPLRSALTPRGKTLLAGSVIVAASGVFLHYPELIGLGIVGVAATAAALAGVARAPKVVVERSVDPARVTRGSTSDARANVVVRNASRRTLPAMSARDLAGSSAPAFSVPRLRPGAASPASIPLPTHRRGVVPSGPLLIDRDDPFGLAQRTLNTGLASELYVRPRTIPLPEVAASLARSVDGPQSDTTMEGTLAFNSLREYMPGDELRHVHWRASAHARTLVVKQHVDTAHAAVAVVVDIVTDGLPGERADVAAGFPACSAGADPAVFDTAVDCAASVAVIAAAQRQPLRLLDTAGEPLLPGTVQRRGGCTADDVLDALTRVNPVQAGAGPVDPLADTLRRLSSGARGSLAAVISTRPMGGLADSLRLLAGCYARVVAVQVVSGLASGAAGGPGGAAGGPAGGAARTGRVVWVTVCEVEDLPAALLRARTAA